MNAQMKPRPFAALAWVAAFVALPLAPRAGGAAEPTTRQAFLKLLDRPRVDLAPQEQEMPAPAGLRQIHFTFASEAGQRVPGVLVEPAPEGTGAKPPRRPAVVVLHGTGGKKESHVNYLRKLAAMGFVAVAIDGRYHGERCAAGTGTADYFAAIARAFKDGGEHPWLYDTAWDVMRLVDYLQARPDVDGSRVGLMGFSKGGMETYLAAAADERVAVAVPCIGVQSYRYALDNDLWRPRIGTVQGAADAAAKDAGVPLDRAFCRRFYDRVVPGIYGEFDGPSMLPLIAPRPLLVINGAEDKLTPVPGIELAAAAARRAYAAAGAQDRFVLRIQPKTGHSVTPESTEAATAWLVKWLTPAAPQTRTADPESPNP